MTPKTQLGIDRYLKSPTHLGKSIGILTHAHVNTSKGQPIYESLLKSHNVRTLFSPQHGFFLNTSQAQMMPTESSIHPDYQIPIYSMYRDAGRDVPLAWLEGLDVVFIDLPDVGVKVYTYIWSMAKMLEACREAQVEVVILDRPNPISKLGVQGPMTNPEYTSFVGLYPIAFCHQLTIGEVALYLNETIQAPLSTVPLSNWHRDYSWKDTGLPWIPPSPNLRTPEAAYHYPATVMIEATNISEGRGTDDPFCQFGAPFLDPDTILSYLEQHTPPGCTLEPVQFTPDSDKYAGLKCYGFRIRIQHLNAYDPVWLGCLVIHAMIHTTQDFAFRDPPYEYEYEKNPFDITMGDPRIREYLVDGNLKALRALLDRSKETFYANTQKHRLYHPSTKLSSDKMMT